MNVFQVVLGVLAIVAMFLVLVIPHETGHFALAKLFGVKVHEYSIGVGALLASTTRGGTLYALRAVPVLGYVRLGGMEPGEFEDPMGFHAKPAYQRLLILFAGPAANFLVAMLLAFGVYASQLSPDPGFVESVMKNLPAYGAGIRPGDSIKAVNGRAVASTDDIRIAAQVSGGKPVTILVKHPNGRVSSVMVRPSYDRQLGRYVIGIASAPTMQDALVGAVAFPVTTTAEFGVGIVQLVSGRIPGGVLGPEGATGAIGLGALTYHAASQGLVQLVTLSALLSMAIGLTNLLPIPALDGGRAVVVLLERLRGRPFDRDRELAVQRGALVALLGLMVLIAFIDVQRLFNGEFPGPR